MTDPRSGAVTYRDFVGAFRSLGLGNKSRVIVHASVSAFGEVSGGPEAMLGAILSTFQTVIVPTFTTRCMLIAPDGPEDNAITPQEAQLDSSQAEFYDPDLPADRAIGRVAEGLRTPASGQALRPSAAVICGNQRRILPRGANSG